MRALFNFFFELCLLRVGPQDLPASRELLLVLLVAYTAVGVLVIGAGGVPLPGAITESLFDVAATLALLRFALKAHRRDARFMQAASAVLGSGALIALIALPVIWNAQRGTPGISGLVLLMLVIWNVAVLGHIIRHTFDIGIGGGAAIASLFTVLLLVLKGLLFGPAPAPEVDHRGTSLIDGVPSCIYTYSESVAPSWAASRCSRVPRAIG